ncbi:helitron helicase-like domain-containing protein [Artemisia annua]|uniref:Helitron helicase-like domain-containing protein n=1 Tax=Artemisia annua TaxID=35608 RepID=A0A2U1P7P2_ARTAN|nr:helitron helicase-like domain-containing protein [Artemisia annua]
MARDMPMDGLHSLACDSASNYQPATSVSHGILEGSSGQYTGLTVMYDVASSGSIVARGLDCFHSNVVLTAALGSPAPALETPGHAAQQVCLMPVQSMMPAHVNAVSQLPAQAIKVDGLVSTFTAANIMPDPLRCHESRLTSEGSDAVPTQLLHNTIREYAPMVLDFSAGEVVQNHVPAESSSNGQPTLSRARMPTRRRSRARGMRAAFNRQHAQAGAPLDYKRFGSCDKVCQHCGALFWLEERRTGMPASAAPQYQKCCAGGRVVLRAYGEYPAYIVDLYSDRHFVDNIRAYNQIFTMTSFGATIDGSIHAGGPYVFRVSGQIYHWIGGFCPSGDETPRFLQMYIYDTDHEIHHRLSHFDPHKRHALREDIIEGLIQFLNQNNALVRLFRTARDKLQEADIPEFHIRLFGVIGANQYELPTADAIGAIVYDGGPESMTEYDVII